MLSVYIILALSRIFPRSRLPFFLALIFRATFFSRLPLSRSRIARSDLLEFFPHLLFGCFFNLPSKRYALLHQRHFRNLVSHLRFVYVFVKPQPERVRVHFYTIHSNSKRMNKRKKEKFIPVFAIVFIWFSGLGQKKKGLRYSARIRVAFISFHFYFSF